MRRAVERRRTERRQIIEEARAYFRGKAESGAIRSAYLVGSVARGDFNRWSDVDVVVVDDSLPASFLERLGLFTDRPPGVEVFPYTPEEFEGELARRNPVALEAVEIGIDLLADDTKPA